MRARLDSPAAATPHPSANAPKAPRTRGRPRSQSIDLAVLQATAELLRDVGERRTTIDAIARRSKTSKSSIYRRWPTRDLVVLDALRLATRGRPDDVDQVIKLERELGSTVHAAAWRGSTVYGSRMMLAVLPMITAELIARTQIGESFRNDIFLPIRRAATVRLGEAIERGEVAPDIDRNLVFDMVYGAMLYRMTIGEPIDANVAKRVADMVMQGVAGPAYRAAKMRPGGEPGANSEDELTG
jgi:AcrR family transcriptional regulator